MFTGIIESLGTLREVTVVEQGVRLEVTVDADFASCSISESVAVNGVCLTVVAIKENNLTFDVSGETLQRTSLGQARVGTRVNLERPLTLSSLMGGHLVQGHVDAKGRLEEVIPSGEGFVIRIAYPQNLSCYIVEKGSIAVDGISLTVARLDHDRFEVAIIPHTWRATNLSSLETGDDVNLEVDVIAKYVEKLMQR